MKKNPLLFFSTLIKNSRPWSLGIGFLMYFLGGGLLVYLGRPINWTIFLLGIICIVLLQSSSYFLKAYYDNPVPLNISLNIKTEKEEDPEKTIDRRVFLEIAITLMTIWAVFTFLLVINHAINTASLFFLAVAFSFSYGYAVPPFRLVYSGYGELVDAILIANLTPAMAMVLQTSDLHRLLPMLTFPITILYLAGSLALSLSTYSTDIKNQRKTLLIRLGWQLGMNIHNFLLLFGYLLITTSLLIGLPIALGTPGLLTLPFAVYQVVHMRQIANGAKPHWNILILLAWVIPLITAYLFTFALWTR